MIYIYSQPGCQPCKMVIKMIEESGVNFTVLDISTDHLAREYVVETLGARSTPVIEYGKEHVSGFTPETKPKVQAFIDAESSPTVYGPGTFLH
ncbi:glutaredoxin family protein [Nocardia sp. IFM 10818]